MEFTTKKCSNQNLVCPGYSTTQKLRAPTLQGGSGKSVLKPAPELQALHGKATKIVFKYRSSAPRRSSIKQKKCFENKKNATGAGWCKKTAFYTHRSYCSNAPYLYNNKKSNNKRGVEGDIYSPEGSLYARARGGATGAGRVR